MYTHPICWCLFWFFMSSLKAGGGDQKRAEKRSKYWTYIYCIKQTEMRFQINANIFPCLVDAQIMNHLLTHLPVLQNDNMSAAYCHCPIFLSSRQLIWRLDIWRLLLWTQFLSYSRPMSTYICLWGDSRPYSFASGLCIIMSCFFFPKNIIYLKTLRVTDPIASNRSSKILPILRHKECIVVYLLLRLFSEIGLF